MDVLEHSTLCLLHRRVSRKAFRLTLVSFLYGAISRLAKTTREQIVFRNKLHNQNDRKAVRSRDSADKQLLLASAPGGISGSHSSF
jgi:hypothetical protein